MKNTSSSSSSTYRIGGNDITLLAVIAVPEFQPETAAAFRFGFHANASAHAFDHFAHQREANASALVIAAQPLEHSENFLLIFPWNSNAIVFKPNSDKILATFGPDKNTRRFSRPHKFHRVVQQV